MTSRPAPFLLRLSVTSVGFVLLIGHGSAGSGLDCDSCSSCGPQCRDLDHEEAFFDVDGCWFDAVELQYPSSSCGILATLHPDGQQIYAGARRRRSNPRERFVLDGTRVRCEATSDDGDGPATNIVCVDTCPMPGEDLSCTGTLRLRDAPLGEPLSTEEINQCPMPDGGMPDLGMPDAFDASTDAEVDSAADADAVDAETDAATDAAPDAVESDAQVDAPVDAEVIDAGADADVDAL